MLEEPTSLRIDDPGVRALFTEPARFQSWLDVEAALALAQAELGIIPDAAAREIVRKAHLKYLDLVAVREGLARTGHPLVPVVWALDRARTRRPGQDGGAPRDAPDARAGAHDRRPPGRVRHAPRHAGRDRQQDRTRDLYLDEAGVRRGRGAGAGGDGGQQHDAPEAQP